MITGSVNLIPEMPVAEVVDLARHGQLRVEPERRRRPGRHLQQLRAEGGSSLLGVGPKTEDRGS